MAASPSLRKKPGVAALGLILVAALWIGLVIFAPLAVVFVEALRKGFSTYSEALSDPDCQAAIALTAQVALVAVPLNALFGLAAAWCVTRFEFVGKALILSLIDLPFSLSPVISGMVWVLLFGANGWFGPQLDAWGVHLVFNFTGIVLATLLVTFPFVARELIPLMQQQGADEEAAAVTLGAGAFDVFFRVTLPKIAWGLLYGVLLCNARAMGEFGAVSVISGHIRGLTDTVPLHVEVLYNEYNFAAAFAVASLLAALALVTLVAKSLLERRFEKERRSNG